MPERGGYLDAARRGKAIKHPDDQMKLLTDDGEKGRDNRFEASCKQRAYVHTRVYVHLRVTLGSFLPDSR